jgi:hypothetical protein
MTFRLVAIGTLMADDELAAIELGKALEWSLYWIGRCAEVPLPLEGQDEWERWEEAKRALRLHGPESPTGVDRKLRRMGLRLTDIDVERPSSAEREYQRRDGPEQAETEPDY